MSSGLEILGLSQEESKFFESLYKELHQNPGLSHQESFAADIAEKLLVEYGYSVTSKIAGYGMVGVIKKGPGKTILLRADMDGLPVGELTGLPYASQQRQIDSDGIEKPVMHACGHDMHVGTCSHPALVSCAKILPDSMFARSGQAFEPNRYFVERDIGCAIPT